MRFRKWNTNRRNLLLSFCLVLGTNLAEASAQAWVRGDVFVGIPVGGYDVFSNQGVYKGFIQDEYAYGITAGCAFNSDFSRLYTTNASDDTVEVYDGTGTTHRLLKSISTYLAGPQNQSVVFNKAGDYFVGHNGAYSNTQTGIAEFGTKDNLVATYILPVTDTFYNSVGWIDLSSDQKTIFYTDGGVYIRRYDLSSGSQLSPINSTGGPYNMGGLRLLPPYDGSGGILAADGVGVGRFDLQGTLVQGYSISNGAESIQDVALDPNGKSFWAVDTYSGTVSRLNIATGAIEVGPKPVPGSQVGFGDALAGLCVRGGAEGPDSTPPVVALSETLPGPPKQVILNTYDAESGLASIVVNNCNNCTAATEAFTSGTNSIITTTATKIDQTRNSSVEISATDVAGNKTTFDPVDLTLENKGYPTVHTIRILSTEHILVVSNGFPGMSKIEVMVNGRTLPEIVLRDRETRSIDLAEYMRTSEKSDVRMQAEGEDHATAWLLFTEP